MNWHNLFHLIKICNRLIWPAILILLPITAYFYFDRNKLPPASTILKQLQTEPIQSRTSEQPFILEHMGKEFIVTPVASYEIKGLVVSKNDISAFYDIYHDKTSEDFQDLCLIWGENLHDEVLLGTKFWNESVSCHIKFKTEAAADRFMGEQLSNNHLLSDDPHVIKLIKSIEVGDQLKMAGFLVNYAPRSDPDLIRRSSLTRKDTGGGACEVFFVTEAQLLKAASRKHLWRWKISFRTLLILLFLKIVLAIVHAQLEFRSIKITPTVSKKTQISGF